MKIRHLIAILLLSTVLLIQNAQSVLVSSQLQGKPLNPSDKPDSMSTTNQITPTSTFNESVEPMQSANWTVAMQHIQAPRAGCFVAKYPSTVWQSVQCVKPPLVPLQPLVPLTVGGGVDEVAYSSSDTLIGSSTGSFPSTSPTISETDSAEGSNYYTLQINSQPFSTNTAYTGNQQLTCVSPTYVCGWEQFVFENDGTSGGLIYIQYWLLGFGSTCTSFPGPPGGWPWTYYAGSSNSRAGCYTDSYATPVSAEPASNLGNLILTGYANFNSNGEDLLCVSGTCSSVLTTDQVLDLYQHWLYSEFNVFGWGGGSTANFNSGTTIEVSNSLTDKNGNAIASSCMGAGYTAETNNLNLVPSSCSTPGKGQIVFTENNLPTVTFYTNPSAGGTIQLQSPTGSANVGGTDSSASENNDILSAQFSVSAPLIVSQLGVYVSSFSPGAAVTLGLYNDNGGGQTALPTTLIAQTTQVQISASNTWLYSSLSSPVFLYPNTPYWVAIETNNVNKVLYWAGKPSGLSPGEPACGVSYSATLPSTYPSCPGSLTSAYFYESIVAGSLTFTNGQSFPVPNGNYPVAGNSASGYAFSSWSPSGSVSVSSSSNNPTTMIVAGAGSLTANFNQGVTTTTSSTTQCNINPSAGNGQYNVEWCDYTGGNVGNQIVTNTWSGPDINRQWGTSNVDNTGRNHDVFATAVGSFSFGYSGPWTLTVQHDDGLRVFVDGGEVYDNWSFITGSDSITVPMSAGTHTVFIEYYAAGPPNLLVLTFAPPVTVTQTTTTTSTSSTSTLTSATSTSGTTTTTTITSTSTSVSGYACVVSTTTSTSVRVSQQATVTSSATSTATTVTSTTGTQIVTTTSFTSTLTQTIVTVTTTSACTLSLTSTSTTTTSSTTTQLGHVVIAIQLQPGWDLVSMPVVPLSTSITDVLKSQIASGEVVSVWSFQGNPPSWRSFVPGTGGSLTTMSDGYGYWVYMRTGDTLYVDGYVIVPGSTPPTYSLVQGWNMVGFKPQPTVQSETIGQYLSSISGKYDANNVWVYTSTGWIRADPSYTLQPGQGMWILMTVPATLRP